MDRRVELTEGKMKKGGRNDPPTGPRPDPPKAQGFPNQRDYGKDYKSALEQIVKAYQSQGTGEQVAMRMVDIAIAALSEMNGG